MNEEKAQQEIAWLPFSYYLEPPIKNMSAKINFAPELFPDVILTFNLNNDLEKAEKDAVLNKLSELKNVYVSDLTSNIIMLDFQIDSTNISEAEVIGQLDQLKSILDDIIKMDTARKIDTIDVS
jgi:uncharacterized protein YpuA (DUF1002 family)